MKNIKEVEAESCYGNRNRKHIEILKDVLKLIDEIPKVNGDFINTLELKQKIQGE